jgi:hypothetical protein
MHTNHFSFIHELPVSSFAARALGIVASVCDRRAHRGEDSRNKTTRCRGGSLFRPRWRTGIMRQVMGEQVSPKHKQSFVEGRHVLKTEPPLHLLHLILSLPRIVR